MRRSRVAAALWLSASAALGQVGIAPADAQVPVSAARTDAAARSGVPQAQIRTLSAERVTWRDGSLGCPREGLVYTQALVAGWRIRLEVGPGVWDYHAGESGAPMLCPAGRAREPLPNSRD